jgi:hypothetical protein
MQPETPATTSLGEAQTVARAPLWTDSLAAVAVVALTLVAACLIIPGAKTRALYGDEIRTWRDSVKESYALILSGKNNVDHAPLSYLLVKITSDALRSQSPWVLRLPSVLCGLLCIPAAFWLGRTVQSNALGIIMSALAAVDLSLVWQSQQSRMYSMLLLIMLVATVQMVKLSNDGGKPRRRWALLGVLISVGLWTHAASVVLLVGLTVLAAALWWQHRESRGQIATSAIIAIAIAVVISSPPLKKLVSMKDRQKIESRSVPTVRDQIKILTRELSGNRDLTSLMAAMTVAGLVMLAYQNPQQRPAAAAMLAVAGFTVVALAIAALRRPVHGARYVTTADPAMWVGISLLLMWGFTRPMRAVQGITSILLAAFVIFQAQRCTQAEQITGTHQYANQFASATKWLHGKLRPGERVICIPRVPLLYRQYYNINTKSDMETAMIALTRLDPQKQKQLLPNRRRRWTRKPTYVMVFSPPNRIQRGKSADPRVLLPTLGLLYQVTVDTSRLPRAKPAQIFIYKFTVKGSWLYDSKGNLLETGKRVRQATTRATTKPATRPATRATTRPASRRS